MRLAVVAVVFVGLLGLLDGCVVTTQAPPPAQPDYYAPAPPPPRGYEAPPTYQQAPSGYVSPAAPMADDGDVYVQLEPPPPPVERPGRPRRGFIWVPGHWDWAPRVGAYSWVPGHWERAMPGRMYVSGHWDRRPRGWVWVPGHWR